MHDRQLVEAVGLGMVEIDNDDAEGSHVGDAIGPEREFQPIREALDSHEAPRRDPNEQPRLIAEALDVIDRARLEHALHGGQGHRELGRHVQEIDARRKHEEPERPRERELLHGVSAPVYGGGSSFILRRSSAPAISFLMRAGVMRLFFFFAGAGFFFARGVVDTGFFAAFFFFMVPPPFMVNCRSSIGSLIRQPPTWYSRTRIALGGACGRISTDSTTRCAG